MSMMTLLLTGMILPVLNGMMDKHIIVGLLTHQTFKLLVHVVFVEAVAQVNNLNCQQKADF